MILKILLKLKFLKRLNKKVASFIFTFIIYIDDLFLRLRIFTLCVFLKKDNKLRKVLLDLKENGVAIIKNYYSDNEIDRIKKECSNLLDKIPSRSSKKF